MSIIEVSKADKMSTIDKSEGHHKMQVKDEQLAREIKNCIEEYYGQYGECPTVRYIAASVGCSKSNIQRYIEYLQEKGLLTIGQNGYETDVTRATESQMVAVPKLGYVPCGPLSEEYECIDGYVRLPLSFVGNTGQKCFLLTASGNSMVDAGISNGDLVLVRQQESAEYNDIVVALVENEVTLKRYRPDAESGQIILHPENKRMKDIVVDECRIQGVAIKVIKDLVK